MTQVANPSNRPEQPNTSRDEGAMVDLLNNPNILRVGRRGADASGVQSLRSLSPEPVR